MTPEFARLVDPIFLAVLRMVQRLERGDRVDIQTQRSEIRTLIDDAEKEAQRPDSRVRPDDYELAKYGLVAWADEILTAAYPQWEEIKLEVEYWGPPGKRAFRFYVEGESKARHATPDVVEVWYLALAMGFKGDIRGAFRNQLNRDPPGGKADPEEARRAWARELAARIREARFPDLPGEPLHCDVPPLTGGKWLTRAVAALVVSLLVGGALWAYAQSSSPANDGKNDAPSSVVAR
jgi:hypothetical protein